MGVWILFAVPVLAAGMGCRRLLILRHRAQSAWSALEAQLDEPPPHAGHPPTL